MRSVGQSIVIERDIHTVYRVAETYPTFVAKYKQAQILYSDDYRQEVSIRKRFLCYDALWIGVAQKEKPFVMKWEQVKGPLKGLRAEWHFTEPTRGRTEVHIRTSFAVNTMWVGRLLEVLTGNVFVRPMLSSILNDLKINAEGMKPTLC